MTDTVVMAKKDILVSVVVPAYNEETTISLVLQRLKKLREKLNLEIIFVDDGSNDRTFDIGKDVSTLKAIRHLKNYGKGAALRTGLKHSTGDILVFQDADFEYPPENILEIVDPIVKKKTDAVFGSRFLEPYNVYVRPFTLTGILKIIGNWILSAVASILYGTRVSDVMTGQKAFSKRVFKSVALTKNGFEVEVEIAAKLLLSGFKLVEVPVLYYPRRKGKSKIGLRHGFSSLFILVVERLSWYTNLIF